MSLRCFSVSTTASRDISIVSVRLFAPKTLWALLTSRSSSLSDVNAFATASPPSAVYIHTINTVIPGQREMCRLSSSQRYLKRSEEEEIGQTCFAQRCNPHSRSYTHFDTLRGRQRRRRLHGRRRRSEAILGHEYCPAHSAPSIEPTEGLSPHLRSETRLGVDLGNAGAIRPSMRSHPETPALILHNSNFSPRAPSAPRSRSNSPREGRRARSQNSSRTRKQNLLALSVHELRHVAGQIVLIALAPRQRIEHLGQQFNAS